MKTTLKKSEIDGYRENGFLMIDDFLTPDELERWRSVVTEAVACRTPPPPNNEYYDNVFKQRVNLWQESPAVRDLVLDPRLGKLAADLEQLEGVRLCHDQSLFKEPWANATTWHVDNPFWQFYSRQATSMWLALDDVTIQNGCMYFLPGTHKKTRFEAVRITANMNRLFEHYPEWATIDPVPAVMPAGSCSFHNALLAHSAGPNMTTSSRRAMVIIFMPDGATFNGQQNTYPPEVFAKLKVGDVLCDETLNPLLYARKGQPFTR